MKPGDEKLAAEQQANTWRSHELRRCTSFFLKKYASVPGKSWPFLIIGSLNQHSKQSGQRPVEADAVFGTIAFSHLIK
jgi:hypothetical protein